MMSAVVMPLFNMPTRTPDANKALHSDAANRARERPRYEKKINKPLPNIKGDLEISHDKNGIFIGGTPNGLKSFSNLLKWLAEFDQEIGNMPAFSSIVIL